MRRIILTLILIVAGALVSRASDTTRVAYLQSRFADNWFIEADGGVNMVFNMSQWGPVQPAAAFRFGKWFTPSIGLRIGLQGLKNEPNGTDTGWFSGYAPFHFYHLDGDLMLNFFNLFRYNEHRFWDVVPFIRAAGIYTATPDGNNIEFGGGLGLHNGLRLGKRVDLAIELSAVAGRERAWRQRGDVILFPSATAGVVVKLGRVGFGRNKPIYIKGDTEYIDREVVKHVTDTVTVVDSVMVQKMREEPLTLFFDIDVTTLNQREQDHLEFYAKVALEPDSVVLLTGSADKETGNSEHNQWLSEQRNAYVRDLLVRVYGLKPENIQEIANGDRKNEFRTPEQNRCVTISFIR